MSESARTNKQKVRSERSVPLTARFAGQSAVHFRKTKSVRRGGPGKQDDEDNSDDVNYEEILNSKENQILDLQQQAEAEARRAAMLESELSLALAAAHRAEEAHSNELAKVESDVARVMTERRTLLEKLQQIEVVEEAVRELYVQMKDRIGEDEHPTPEQLNQEKEQLKEESILVVLGHLHATLKNLWAFKVDAESDMRAKRLDRVRKGEAQVTQLKEEVRRLQQQLDKAQHVAELYEEKAAAEVEAKGRVYEESLVLKSALEVKTQEVLEEMHMVQRENAELRAALAAALEEGRRRDGLVLRNKQLESARHFDRVAQDREMRSMHTEHSREVEVLYRELAKLDAALRDNEALRQRCEELERQLLSAKRSYKSYHTDELQHQVTRLSSALSEKTAEERRLRGDVTRLSARIGSAASTAQDVSGPRGSKSFMTSLKAQLNAGRAAEPNKEDKDPVYDLIVNVDKMHKEARSTIKSLKQELAQAPFQRKFLSFEPSGGGGSGGGGGGRDSGVSALRESSTRSLKSVMGSRPYSAMP